MSYDSRDQSVALARPVLAIDFEDDFGTHWRYNTSAEDITLLGETYTSDACKVSETEISGNDFRNRVTIELSRQNGFAWQFISAPLESKVTVTIYRVLDPDYQFMWTGVVEAVSFSSEGVPKIECTPKTASAARVGWRRRTSMACPLVLFGQEIGGCKVNAESFKITGVISAYSGTTYESDDFAAQADGWLQGGELVIGNARRLIKSHTVNSDGSAEVEINRKIDNPETNSAGQIEFTAYAGCDHIYTTCDTKFSNKVNYGGLEFLPVKNPFVGDGIV